MSDDPSRNPNGTMRKGFSANRKGRPPRSRNMLTLFNEKRDEKIKLKVNNKYVSMSRLEAWVTNLWNKAIELDPKASATVVAIMRASGQLNSPTGDLDGLDEDSEAALKALIGRLPGKPDGHDG